jgi:hypothetical protein
MANGIIPNTENNKKNPLENEKDFKRNSSCR